MTLRDIWERKGYRSAARVARAAHVSNYAVYKLLRRQSLLEVCKAAILCTLALTEEEYAQLESEPRQGQSHKHNPRQ